MASKQACVRKAAGGGVMHDRAGLCAAHAVAQLCERPPMTATWVELSPHVVAKGGLGGGGEGGGGVGGGLEGVAAAHSESAQTA